MFLLSSLVWLGIGLIALAWELIGVFEEKSLGILPLTRVLRDRLMKKSYLIKIAVLFGWVWLGYHFFIEKA